MTERAGHRAGDRAPLAMRLRVLLPGRALVDAATRKVSAEGTHGHFTLLPRHVDLVSALVPGLLSWESVEGAETFAAVDGGLLVKRGTEVTVATRRAVLGPGLGALRRTVEREFGVVDERDRAARSAIARLEVDFIQRFLELEQRVRA